MAEMVTDYLEGDLPLHHRLAARVHLFACSACTYYFDQMRRTVAMLRTGPAASVPPSLEDALVRSVIPDSPPD